jgi:hypothetical protein
MVVAYCLRICAVAAASATVGACVEEPPPRSFTEFMEDAIAREGTLIRCNEDRTATASDVECMNARRAAAAIATQDDAEQRVRLEAQSEARLAAARQRYDAQKEAARQAELAAEAEAQRAYDAQFEHGTGMGAVSPSVDAASMVHTPGATSLPATHGSPVPAATTMPNLEPVDLPPSVRAPLTTISLPPSATVRELEPAGPTLEEIELPERARRAP